jgi:hypothetical protein
MCTLSVTLNQNFQHFVIDKKGKFLEYHFCHLQMSSKVTNSNYNFSLPYKNFVTAYSACAKTKFLPKKLQNNTQNEKFLNFFYFSHLSFCIKIEEIINLTLGHL